MNKDPDAKLPEWPKLRPVEPQWIEHEGQRYLHAREPLGLTDEAVLIPGPLAPLLALCDGTRNVPALRAGFALRYGVQLTAGAITDFLAQLDKALLLENGSYKVAAEEALAEYRRADHRRPSHAGLVYPRDRDELSATLEGYCAQVQNEDYARLPGGTLVGIVCPHIDYARGCGTYARLWRRASPSLDDVELVIVFGTNHHGGPGTLTPTRQDYMTPLGALPTDENIVDGLAEIMGRERAFAEEIHHVKEHSIELALVWLRYFLGRRTCPIVPILCGSFQHFVTAQGNPDEDDTIGVALEYLRQAVAGRKTLVMAAADLAHVGPAFGDPSPLDPVSRARLAVEDSESIAAICEGDAAAFFERSHRESDSRRICGLPPIYLMLRFLEQARGESTGYEQCPADQAGGSVVSIAGVLMYEG